MLQDVGVISRVEGVPVIHGRYALNTRHSQAGIDKARLGPKRHIHPRTKPRPRELFNNEPEWSMARQSPSGSLKHYSR